MYTWPKLIIISSCLVTTVALAQNSSQSSGYNFGSTPDAAEIQAWDIDVRPDGAGLPAGSGDALQGEEVYLQNCAACHGEFGEGVGRFPALFGGDNSLTSDRPTKTVGSFWPYATTLWDYINRSMPFGNAQSLSADEVYSLVAYVLNMNELLDEDVILDQLSLPKIIMPNRDGFSYPDPRPDMVSKACMGNCKNSVEISSEGGPLPE